MTVTVAVWLLQWSLGAATVELDVKPTTPLTCNTQDAACKMQMDQYAVYTQKRMVELANYTETLKSQFETLMKTPDYAALSDNIDRMNTTVVNFNTTLFTRKNETDTLTKTLTETRESVQSATNSMLTLVHNAGTSMQDNFNKQLQTVVQEAQEILQNASDYAYHRVTEVDSENKLEVSYFLGNVTAGFLDAENQLNVSEAQMRGDFQSMAWSLGNASTTLNATIKNFETAKANVKTNATDYVNGKAPTDLAAKSASLATTLNDTAKNFALILKNDYSEAMDGQTSGLKAVLKSFLDEENLKLNETEWHFKRLFAQLNTDADALKALPNTVFDSLLKNLSASELQFTGDENKFHNNLVTALSSAAKTLDSTSKSAKQSRDNVQAQWDSIRTMLTQGSTTLNTDIIKKLAALDADASKQIVLTAAAGEDATRDIIGSADLTGSAVAATSDAATQQVATSAAAAAGQLSAIQQLLATDGASLNATLEMFSDFLNSRTTGMQEQFDGALDDFANTMGEVSGGINAATNKTMLQIIAGASDTTTAIFKELDAIAATGSLSADQLKLLYGAAAANNAAQFSEVARQMGVLSGETTDMEANIAELSAKLKTAAQNAETVVSGVRDTLNTALWDSSMKLSDISTSLNAAVAVNKKTLVDEGEAQVAALTSSTSPTISTLNADLTTLTNTLSAKTAEYKGKIPTLASQSQSVRDKVDSWLGRVAAAKEVVKAAAEGNASALNTFWTNLKTQYRDSFTESLTNATKFINDSMTTKVSHMVETVIAPALQRITELDSNTNANITAMETLLTSIDGVIGRLDNLQGLVKSQVANSFGRLKSEYLDAVETHSAAVSRARDTIKAKFDTLDQQVAQLSAQIEPNKAALEKDADEKLKTLSSDLTSSIAGSATVIQSLMDLIQKYKDEDAAFLVDLQNIEDSQVNATAARLAEVKAEVTEFVASQKPLMQINNLRVMSVINQLVQVLKDADATNSEASEALKAFASSLSAQTTGVADSIAKRLSNTTAVDEVTQKLNSGSTNILSSGTAVISAAVDAVAEAAGKTSSAALARSSALVASLQQTADAYAAKTADTDQVGEVTLTAIAALLATYQGKQKTFSDWVDQETANRIAKAGDIDALFELWNKLTEHASAETELAVEDVAALIASVHAAVSTDLEEMENTVKTLSDSASANATKAVNDMAKAADDKQTLLTEAATNLDGFVNKISGDLENLKSNNTATMSELSLLKTTSGSSSDLSNKFAQWLGQFQAAFTQDIAKISHNPGSF